MTTFRQLKLHYKILFSENETLKANFCNGSKTHFSSAASFLPGENVTITCSVPELGMAWYSPLFDEFDESPVLMAPLLGVTRGARLDGAITFNLNELVSSPNPPCIITTATIANIQESLQGLRLICGSLHAYLSTVDIYVVGKLYVVPKTMLSF